MNVCFSLLLGLSVCQADAVVPAPPVDSPDRMVETATEGSSQQPTCAAVPGSVSNNPQPCNGGSQACSGQPCNGSCQTCNNGCQVCNGGCPLWNDCNDDDECDDDECKDPRKGGFCHCYCRSTCDMPQHYAYPPKYHGYYYFLPYNYSMVLRDIEAVKALNGDPRMPYATAMFESVYSEGVYEEATGFNRVPTPFPTVSKTLPDLQQMLKGE